MKIVITSTGKELKSPFDLRFGRAAWFCLYDEQTGDINFIENENLNANSGVGVKTAERMLELGVTKIISGDFGQKAKDILDRFNVQIIIIQDEDITVQDLIDRLKFN